MSLDHLTAINEANCAGMIKIQLPNSKVGYSIDYGDKASRDRGNIVLAQELEKLKE